MKTILWNDIRKYKASHFIYIGELCRYLNNQSPRPDDSDNPLQYILGNGMRGEYWMEFKKRFGIRKIVEVYGVATNEVADILNQFGQIEDSNVYGVKVNGTEGRCGMVALKLLEGEEINWNDFAQYVIKHLPVYARPYFIRLRGEIDATNSYKQLKTNLQKEGFDPGTVKDPLFFLDPRKNSYVPLTAELFTEINEQKISF